jgi:hypothetical protein
MPFLANGGRRPFIPLLRLRAFAPEYGYPRRTNRTSETELGAEARAAHVPTLAIDRRTKGRGPEATGGGCYACRTRAQPLRGQEHDFATVRRGPSARFSILRSGQTAQPVKYFGSQVTPKYKYKPRRTMFPLHAGRKDFTATSSDFPDIRAILHFAWRSQNIRFF